MTTVIERPIDRARRIAGLISEDALESERLGRPTDRVAAAMHEANLFSMLRPVAAGGLGCSRADYFETVEEVGKADGAAGWCLSVCSAIIDVIHRAATSKVNAEIFGAGPVAVWTSLLPRATSVPAKGGFKVSGAFAMGSGSAFSDWVLVAAPLDDRDGRQWFRAHIVPKADVVIDAGSWDVMGLRATTSVEYRITDRFVPLHRTFEYPFLQSAEAGSVSAQYGVFLNQIGLTAFACGVGLRALDELILAAPKTKRAAGEGFQSDDNVVQFGIGELDGRLSAARGHFLRLVSEHDQLMEQHGYIDPAKSVELSQAAQTLTRAARDMTIFAFDHAGTNVIFASHPLQRCLRDIFTGLKHASFTPTILTRIGKTKLGVDSARVRLV